MASRIIVVGAGLMGAAATLALSRRGHAVTTLEAFEPRHRRGSSHGSSRIVRRSYVESHYLELSGRAIELWRSLEREAGKSLLALTGGLEFGPAHDVEGVERALLDAGERCELLSAEDAKRRWTHMRFEGTVLHAEHAGVVDPELAIDTMLGLARGIGADVQFDRPVLRAEPDADGVRVYTEAAALEADVVVVAAGPWLADLIGDAIALPPLTVTQQQVFHFPRRPEADASPWPVVLHARDDLEVFALPGGRDGGAAGNMKLGFHDAGPPADAREVERRLDEAGRDAMVEYVRRWWPGLETEPIAGFTCLYTWTPDKDFILDRVGQIVVCSPCSGHGAKFAPAIGELVADLVEGQPAQPWFALSRFA